ncbi:flagellar basal body P-ring formation chaperone FlgA [Massilia sp. TS11]|uniref:flagellar basal body P-ring formation chaperone FlgA n=1 Tax=Massilia sp. TS11 TaxID=2908003 RepID=UPI001EDA6CD5|nr:flagellar basal body P-ring formation chaperone FlgA [Massilia sp. TS11]MCG2582854.1 flagellar basal body P-ring formation protein FlgA [Massilia sp. TS11]
MKSTLIALMFASALPAAAQVAAPARQEAAALSSLVQAFLESQTAALPGTVSISVREPDARLNLGACPAPQAFLGPGQKAWGKTVVGVRCAAPSWTLYIQAQVSVQADYVAAAMPLAAGQPIRAEQLVTVKGDLTQLPPGILTDPAQAVGKMPANALASGLPLRADVLKSAPVVQQGQLVQVVAGGRGFHVSAEARAIGTAGDGQVVQVRTANGAVVSGIARAGGRVEVAI